MFGSNRGLYARAASSDRDAGRYLPLATAAPQDAEPPQRTGALSGLYDTDGSIFNLAVGVVVCFSAALLWLEVDEGLLSVGDGGRQQDGQDIVESLSLHRSASPTSAFSACEPVVAAFFLAEMLARFADKRAAYCSDPWFALDMTVVAQASLDLTMPWLWRFWPHRTDGAPLFAWIASLCCLTRACRVLRLLRLSPRLRFLARDFARALTATAWVGIAVLVLNFVCAVFLSALVGQRADRWGDQANRVGQWFGSVGKSMRTLLAVMTLSGWADLDEVLSEVIPPAAVTAFFAGYLGSCFFAAFGLVAGLVGGALAREPPQLEGDLRVEEKRWAAVAALLDAMAPECRGGHLSRDGLGAALSDNEAIERLKLLGMHADGDEVEGLFDQLLGESERQRDGLVPVDLLAEGVACLRGRAGAAQVLDVKLGVRALRRETAAARGEAASFRQELRAAIETERQRVSDELREQVAAVRTAQSALRAGIAGVATRVGPLADVKRQLDSWERRDSKSIAERARASAAVDASLAAMSRQIASGFLELGGRLGQLEAKVGIAANHRATADKEDAIVQDAGTGSLACVAPEEADGGRSQPPGPSASPTGAPAAAKAGMVANTSDAPGGQPAAAGRAPTAEAPKAAASDGAVTLAHLVAEEPTATEGGCGVPQAARRQAAAGGGSAAATASAPASSSSGGSAAAAARAPAASSSGGQAAEASGLGAASPTPGAVKAQVLEHGRVLDAVEGDGGAAASLASGAASSAGGAAGDAAGSGAADRAALLQAGAAVGNSELQAALSVLRAVPDFDIDPEGTSETNVADLGAATEDADVLASSLPDGV